MAKGRPTRSYSNVAAQREQAVTLIVRRRPAQQRSAPVGEAIEVGLIPVRNKRLEQRYTRARKARRWSRAKAEWEMSA
jgi:hypothetical protein